MPLLSRVLPTLSLRCLLLIAAAIGLAPLAVLDIARLNQAKHEALTQAEQTMNALARQTAGRQQEIVQRAFGLLSVLTNIPAVRDGQPDCNSILSDLRATQASITNIMVVDATGRGECGTNDARTFSVGARPYFTEMKRTRSFVISNVLVGQASGREVIVAALPILDDSGDVVRAITLGIDLAWLKQIVVQTSAVYSATVFILDRDGTQIAASAPTGALLTQPEDFYRQLLAAPTGAWQSDRPFGEPTVYGIERMADLGMTLAVGIPRATVFAPIERAFWTDLALLVATAFGSFGITVLFVELGVSRGLRHLQGAAQSMVSGQPQRTVDVPNSVREVENLSRSFNTMVTELEGFAYHDRLTGLGNRRLLERYLAEATRSRQTGPFAVLAIDLDEFKPVNDIFGHRAGDHVLAQVSERLIAHAPGAELVARLGGDEFIVVLREEQQEASRIAARLRDAVSASYAVEDWEVNIGCCIGVAFVGREDLVPGPVEMLDRADEALYQAKRSGRSRIVLHGPDAGGPRLVAGNGLLAAPQPRQAAG